MKFSYAAIVAVSASFASAAYTASDIPSCAISCFETGAPQVGCTVTDQSCQCAKASELTDKITGCVTGACSIEDALKTQEVSTGICEQLSSSATSAAAATSTASGSSSVPITTTTTSTLSGSISAPSNSTTTTTTATGFFITTPPPSGNVTALTTTSRAAASSTTLSTTETESASATETDSADGDSSSTNSASGTASAPSSSGAAHARRVDGLAENFGLVVAIALGYYLVAAI